MAETASAQDVLSDYLEELEYISDDRKLKQAFLDDADVLEHTYENCKVRQEVSLRRDVSLSEKVLSIPAYRSRKQEAVPIHQKYNQTHIPSPPRDTEIDLLQYQNTTRTQCRGCRGNKRVPCDCGNGREECPQCHGNLQYECGACGGDGYDECLKCGGKGEKKCPECGGWTGSTEPENCSTCPGTQTIPCPNRNCHNGKITCQECSGGLRECQCGNGTILCTTCKGAREVECPKCAGHGERIQCQVGTLRFTLHIDRNQVASRKDMPVQKISDAEPTEMSVDMTDTGDGDDGIIQRGTREWRVPTHRLKYRLEGEVFTVHKVGETFHADAEPNYIYRNAKRSVKRRSVFTTLLGCLLPVPLLVRPDIAPWAFMGYFVAETRLNRSILDEIETIEFESGSLEPVLHLSLALPSAVLFWIAFSHPLSGLGNLAIVSITCLVAVLALRIPMYLIPNYLDRPFKQFFVIADRFDLSPEEFYVRFLAVELIVAAVLGWGAATVFAPRQPLSTFGVVIVCGIVTYGFIPFLYTDKSDESEDPA